MEHYICLLSQLKNNSKIIDGFRDATNLSEPRQSTYKPLDNWIYTVLSRNQTNHKILTGFYYFIVVSTKSSTNFYNLTQLLDVFLVLERDAPKLVGQTGVTSNVC